MTLTFKRIAAITFSWWVLVAVLSATQVSALGALNVLGFSFVVLVPGFLTLLVARLEKLPLWQLVLFSFGLSLLEVLGIALLGNTVLPYVGVDRPLDRLPVLAELWVLVTGLLAGLWWRHRRAPLVMAVSWRTFLPTQLDKIFALLPLLLVTLSVMGATSLNNGGSNIFTLAMLLGVAIYLGVLVTNLRKLSDNTVVLALFMVGLSLLLMTSLRGWHTTGHDVQREYRLFLLTADSGHWSIAAFRDAYNACLSVTILPTVLYKLLHVSSEYMFKTFFQIMFAVSPAIVFLIARRYASRLVAVLAAVYFMSFPTFFGDMPMLNRQEVAFIFVGLALLALFSVEMPRRAKQVCFFLLSLGVIVSHYSTNYNMLAILAFCVIARVALRWLKKMVPSKRYRQLLSLESSLPKEKRSIITWQMVTLLAAASFMWSVQLTHTSHQLTKVATETVKNIKIALNHDYKSDDAYFSYEAISKLDTQQKLDRYFEQIQKYSRMRTSDGAFYSPEAYSQYRYPIVEERMVPLTRLGTFLNNKGVPVAAINDALHQNAARFLQLMLLIGTVALFALKAYRKKFSSDYRFMQVAAITTIAAMLLMPVLLVEYDLSRVFQQLLFIAGVPIVIGSAHLLPKAFAKLNRGVAVSAALAFLIVTSGVLTVFFGGYRAPLHLFNGGQYYDLYSNRLDEEAGAQWLNAEASSSSNSDVQTEVYADRFAKIKIQSVYELNTLNDIYPGLIRKNAFVYLGSENTVKHQASTFYNGQIITYQYPIQFLDENKNLIYNNGGAAVYR